MELSHSMNQNANHSAAPCGIFSPTSVSSERVGNIVATSFIQPGLADTVLSATRIDMDAGAVWRADNADTETVGLVLSGSVEFFTENNGTLLKTLGYFFASPGRSFRLRSTESGTSLFLWSASVPGLGVKPSGKSGAIDDGHAFSFRAKLDVDAGYTGSVMSFHVLPPTTSALALHSATYEPGEQFPPHVHADGYECFIALTRGEGFVNGRWHPMHAGDVLLAPPGHRHGARNPHDGTGTFITAGGPTPFDLTIYKRAGLQIPS